MTVPDVPYPCVLEAWQAHEAVLRHWLLSRLSDAALADDILQDVFVKALREGGHFCRLDSPRAWLYQVARHAVIDRLSKATVPDGETLAQPEAWATCRKRSWPPSWARTRGGACRWPY